MPKKIKPKPKAVAPVAKAKAPSSQRSTTPPLHSPVPLPDTLIRVAHGLIDPSPFNPRTVSGVSEASIAELAASIKVRGIVVPLILRPHPANPQRFQLVAGERRYLAAGLLKLPDVPARVAPLSDNDAVEIQAIENLQRENLNELEEALGYRTMLDLQQADGAPCYTMESLSARVSKPTSTIYGRLKLLAAPELARRAYLAGEMPASILLLIARIPDAKAADKAARECLNKHGNGTDADPALLPKDLSAAPERRSYRSAKELVQTKYMVRLKGTRFPLEDADLVPRDPAHPERGGGPCPTCPFRSGNRAALEPDLISEHHDADYNRVKAGSADVCTLPACFKRKNEALVRREAAKVKEDGNDFIKGGAKLFRHNYAGGIEGSQQLVSPDYIDLAAPFPGHTGKKPKTWEQALGKHLPARVSIVRDPQQKVRTLLPIAEALAAAKAAGHVVKPPADGDTFSGEARRQHDEQERLARERRGQALHALAYGPDGQSGLVDELLGKVRATAVGLPFWQMLAKRSGTRGVPTATVADCVAAVLIAEFRLEQVVRYQGEFEPEFYALCKFYGINLAKLAKEALTEEVIK